MTITAIKRTTQSPKWYDTTLAPCPIQNRSGFEFNLRLAAELRNPKRIGSVCLEIINSARDDLWNGIGTSLEVEIFHLASIHSETTTNMVFSSGNLKNKLLSAINFFFEIAKSLEYLHKVLAYVTSKFAFEFSPAVTRYINKQFTKAYRKSSTLLSCTDYNTIQSQGLLCTGKHTISGKLGILDVYWNWKGKEKEG